MPKIQLSGHLKPSAFLKRMLKHSDVSETSKTNLLATKIILGKKARFYTDGTRTIDGIDLTDSEQYESQILRFAHASILINEPVGDKNACWVDATKDVVEVILYNMPIKQFIQNSKSKVTYGNSDPDFLLNVPLKSISEM